MDSKLKSELVGAPLDEFLVNLKDKETYHPFKYCLRASRKSCFQENGDNKFLTKESSRGNPQQSVLSKDVCLQIDISPQTLAEDNVRSMLTLDIKDRPKSEPKSANIKQPDSTTASPIIKAKSLRNCVHLSFPRVANPFSKPPNKKYLQKPPLWKSSHFKSPFITAGLKANKRETSQFAYDLSPDELRCMASSFKHPPMKPASQQELQLLRTGQRLDYLSQRYLHSPVGKYNYPEATSWRIGWLNHKQQ